MAFVAEALGALFLRLGEAEAARVLLGDVARVLAGDAVRFFAGDVARFSARDAVSFLVGDVLSVLAVADLVLRPTKAAATLFFFSDLGIHFDGIDDTRAEEGAGRHYRFLTAI